ncbi:MAG: hypothetical protein CFE44_12460 [Burkholderiales bacterium PBB4]|nr:MAG: hypothetical protein CFE44_12460 [Burkholderiales bacterium PBB4]
MAPGTPVGRLLLAAPRMTPTAAQWMQQGATCIAAQDFEQAVYAFHQAYLQSPADAYARFWLGESLFHLGRYADSVTVLADLDPGTDAALDLEHALTLGRALQLTGQSAQAELVLLKAFVAHPQQEAAAYNLAVFYEQAHQPAQALQFLEPAVARFPESARLNYNLGVNYANCGHTDAAVAAFEATLRIDPHHLHAHQNLALHCLRTGLWCDGWRHYAWRFNRHQWEGSPHVWVPHTPVFDAHMAGTTIELVGEQGLGDELFFLRFVPELVRRGARVCYRVGNDRLLPLFEPLVGSGLLHCLVPAHAPIQGGDSRMLVGDLPLALWGHRTSPADRSCPAPLTLQPTPQATARMYEKLPALAAAPVRPRLGLTWRAGTAETASGFNPNRLLSKQVPLQHLLDILQPLDIDVVILQRNPTDDELTAIAQALGPARCRDASMLDQNLCELLALLNALDGLVGVSNTNVHLMASLGKGGHILVPSPPEFRWMSEGSQSPWLPHFHVLRQTGDGNWDPAMAQLRAQLEGASAALRPRC